MSSLRLSVLAVCAAVAGAPAFAQGVVINEFVYDDSSTDDREFVELFNSGAAPVDISGWILDANDTANPSNNPDFTIPSGTTLAAGGYYVLGAATVANVNLIVGVSNLWENSNETIELRDSTGALIDAVAYEVNKGIPSSTGTWPTDVGAEVGDGLWGNMQSIDANECSWARNRDGYDTNHNGRDFRQIGQTPGTSNNLPSALPIFEMFDGFAHDAAIPGWSNSYIPLKAIDPTNPNPPNPSAIAASPQGGNAAILWDPAGGGDYATIDTDMIENVIFEAWVYLDGTLEPAGNYEEWVIGVQGTHDSFGNHAGFAGTSTAANTGYGGSGVAVIFQNREASSAIYLVDTNDSGWGGLAVTPENILGEIPIVAGVNDGWQRVRLQAGKDFAELRFGGTFTQPDGQVLSGRTTMGSPGGIYLTYRERLDNNGAANPLIFDFLIVRDGIADVEYFGAATPNSVGTPTVAPNAMPTLGDANFGYELSGLTPLSQSILLIGFAEYAVPLNLEPLGAQTGSRLYVDSAVGLTLLADANGDASQALAIPNVPALSGGAVYVQAINVDPAIPAALPIAQTEAVKTTLGN